MDIDRRLALLIDVFESAGVDDGAPDAAGDVDRLADSMLLRVVRHATSLSHEWDFRGSQATLSSRTH